jgi:multiple sugar transport system permease protein
MAGQGLTVRKQRMPGKSASRQNTAKTAALLIMPSLVVMGAIILYPLLNAVWLSLFNYQLTKPNQMGFSLLDNYAALISDQRFWGAFQTTVLFTAITVAVSLILGMVMALALDQLPKRLAGIRGIFMLPWVIPGIVVGYLFMYIFDVQVGIANFVLQRLNLIQDYLPWLMRGDLAMAAIIIAHVWSQAPFYMLMLTAGMKAIPDDVKEAAYVEGAGRWQEFWNVTFPYLKGIILITSLLMVIRNFNNFPIIYTMTGGGPVYSTTTSVIYIFRLAFEQYNIGYASAVGTVWVIVLMFFSIFYIRALQKDF